MSKNKQNDSKRSTGKTQNIDERVVDAQLGEGEHVAEVVTGPIAPLKTERKKKALDPAIVTAREEVKGLAAEAKTVLEAYKLAMVTVRQAREAAKAHLEMYKALKLRQKQAGEVIERNRFEALRSKYDNEGSK